MRIALPMRSAEVLGTHCADAWTNSPARAARADRAARRYAYASRTLNTLASLPTCGEPIATSIPSTNLSQAAISTIRGVLPPAPHPKRALSDDKDPTLRFSRYSSLCGWHRCSVGRLPWLTKARPAQWRSIWRTRISWSAWLSDWARKACDEGG